MRDRSLRLDKSSPLIFPFGRVSAVSSYTSVCFRKALAFARPRSFCLVRASSTSFSVALTIFPPSLALEVDREVICLCQLALRVHGHGEDLTAWGIGSRTMALLLRQIEFRMRDVRNTRAWKTSRWIIIGSNGCKAVRNSREHPVYMLLRCSILGGILSTRARAVVHPLVASRLVYSTLGNTIKNVVGGSKMAALPPHKCVPVRTGWSRFGVAIQSVVPSKACGTSV